MDNNKELQHLFQVAKDETEKITYDKAIDKLQKSLEEIKAKRDLNNKSTRFLKIGLVVLAPVLGIYLMILAFSKNEAVANDEAQIQEKSTESFIGDPQEEAKNQKVLTNDTTFETDEAKRIIAFIESLPQPKGKLSNEDIKSNSSLIEAKAEGQSVTNNTFQKRTASYASPYQGKTMPVLDRETIAMNYEKKEKLLKLVYRKSKRLYSLVPEGVYPANGEKITTGSFWIKNTEVTVGEYMTFLFDLIIQKREKDYLEARPNENAWNKILAFDKKETFAKNYFSHEAFRNFPMTCISAKGAELYCKWLSEELNERYKTKRNFQEQTIRIPNEDEWIAAASGGVARSTIYPWIGETVRNEKGFYLANYRSSDEHPKKIEIDGATFTARVGKYKANDFGLYDMAGNVAEIIYMNGSDKIFATKGGSWFDTADKLQINASPGNQGKVQQSALVGFRPIIVVD